MTTRLPLMLPLVLSTLFVSATLTAEEPVLDDSNSWAFSLPADPFSADAQLDLRYLNEQQSGQAGFIRLSEDGNHLVRGDGQPIRFWAVGTDGHGFEPAEMEEHCRWLAKLGVNLARLHVTICRHEEGARIEDVDQKLIDGCFRFIKAAKDQGIYVLISPFYAHFDLPASWGLEGGRQDAEGVIFVDPRLQEAYRQWTRQFYTTVNPYTGLAICDDPTVAVIQVHNEDSLFFWTQQNMAVPQKKRLARRFAQWLVREYGSLDAAWARWEGARGHDYDDLQQGVVGVFDVYFLTRDWEGGTAVRLRDQTRFMAELQREFYQQMGQYLREELGCKQLLNATNWRTANDARLKAVERYTYHALDIDAENEYVGSDFQHQGPNSNYRIDPGHYLVNESVLSKPFEMCTNWIQEEGHPFFVTETAWKNPNRYQSEGPFLVAAFQSLNGVDAVCWFSCQTPRYEEEPRKTFWRVGDQMATHKWNHCYPAMMAGFPANALLYRRGYLQEAEPVVRQVRGLDEVWNRSLAALADNEVHGDQRRPPELQPGWRSDSSRINPAVFQVGPVRSELGGDPTQSQAIDLSPYLDPGRGTIRSVTGELVWNYRDEICTMDAPKAQGVTGFLARSGGRFQLSDVLIESQNEYATINVVALDDQPIRVSRRVLVQVVTVNRLTGFRTRDARFTVGQGEGAYEVDGEQIVNIGQPPFRIADTQVTLSVANPFLTSATVLDINGYARDRIAIRERQVVLPRDAVYVILSDQP